MLVSYTTIIKNQGNSNRTF